MESDHDFQEAIPNCDVAIVCVPTPVDKDLQPNIDSVMSAIDSIVSSITDGSRIAIVLESTVQPGTTENVFPHQYLDTVSLQTRFSLDTALRELVRRRLWSGGCKQGNRNENPQLSIILSNLYRAITSAR